MYNEAWPFSIHIIILIASGILVGWVGVRLARYAQELAYMTGLGQALTGAIFLGAATSLSGIVTSVTAAAHGHAELAASNAIGGIAAQTVFLAIADMVYRKANLEHAAASDENILQGVLLIILLTFVLLTISLPSVEFLKIHPVTPLLFLTYIFGQRLVYRAKGQDMWKPRITEFTEQEPPEKQPEETSRKKSRETPQKTHFMLLPSNGELKESVVPLWVRFPIAAVAIGILGYLLANSGITIANRTGLNETILGGIFTAVATSFPELVTAVAAVRLGALTLAVSDIIGGNAFDMIFLAVADVAYREGSIYHFMGSRPLFLILLTILLTCVLLLGLIRRQKHGIANIGFESILLLIIYGFGFALIVLVL